MIIKEGNFLNADNLHYMESSNYIHNVCEKYMASCIKLKDDDTTSFYESM